MLQSPSVLSDSDLPSPMAYICPHPIQARCSFQTQLGLCQGWGSLMVINKSL